MAHLLTIDIGNTNISCGIFLKSGRLVFKAKIPTQDEALKKRLARLIKKCGAEVDVIISSVVPAVLRNIKATLKKMAKGKIFVLGENAKVPVRNLYRKKSQVGQDRLVNAFAAASLYGAPCVVVDFGTAVTFDVVSAAGDYLGGLILPGIGMSLAGLHEKTALLPKVKLKGPALLIARDTIKSIQSGIILGLAASCDGLAAAYKKSLGPDTAIIATGGNSGLIKKYSRAIGRADEDLTVKGLYLIWKNIR